jgi:predicted transcriptional regulator
MQSWYTVYKELISLIVKLGLIISESHVVYIKQMQQKLENYCHMKLCVIKDFPDIVTCYLKHYNDVDAFVLSGPSLSNYLHKKINPVEKPCYVIYDDEANILKHLFKIFVNHPALDSSRVYFDSTSDDMIATLTEIFPSNKLPYMYPLTDNNLDLYAEEVYQRHLTLWQNNQIDLSVTRFGMHVDRMKAAGMKCYFVEPSPEYVFKLLMQAINNVKLEKLSANKIAVAYIVYPPLERALQDNFEREFFMQKLYQATIAFAKETDCEFVVRQREDNVEVFSTFEEISQITEELTVCHLQRYLKGKLHKRIAIGYGSGQNITQAKTNAGTALNNAIESGGDASYFVVDDHRVIGPLEAGERQMYSNQPNMAVVSVSNYLNISSAYLQKLITYAAKNKTNMLSTEEVSALLGVAHRSANRILNHIVDKNGAVVTTEKKQASKGRPKKYYQMRFLNTEGNLIKFPN